MVIPSFNASQEALLSAGSLYDPTVLHVLISDNSSKDSTLRTQMAFQRPFYFKLKWKLFWMRKFAKLTNIFPKSGFSHIMTHFSRKLFDAGFRWEIRCEMNSLLKIDNTQWLWGNIECLRTSRQLNDSAFWKLVKSLIYLGKIIQISNCALECFYPQK